MTNYFNLDPSILAPFGMNIVMYEFDDWFQID